ncbi:DUF655 domain-containing protein [Candidatus Woesearchaeota archaeon]|nr:DUF655 domain-containing protein [Candidatus Woesearchaeota archaeon]
MEKEESAIVLDFLPNGYPFDPRPMHRKTPIAQALGMQHFPLLEIVPKKGVSLQLGEEVYMGEGKREKVHHVIGRIPSEKLTQTAKSELEFALKKIIARDHSKFLEFFNKAGPITARRHQLELLPGIVKKQMWEILEARKEKPFENFEDIKSRVKLLPDPEKVILKRILMELEEADKYKIFIR